MNSMVIRNASRKKLFEIVFNISPDTEIHSWLKKNTSIFFNLAKKNKKTKSSDDGEGVRVLDHCIAISRPMG